LKRKKKKKKLKEAVKQRRTRLEKSRSDWQFQPDLRTGTSCERAFENKLEF